MCVEPDAICIEDPAIAVDRRRSLKFSEARVRALAEVSTHDLIDADDARNTLSSGRNAWAMSSAALNSAIRHAWPHQHGTIWSGQSRAAPASMDPARAEAGVATIDGSMRRVMLDCCRGVGNTPVLTSTANILALSLGFDERQH